MKTKMRKKKDDSPSTILCGYPLAFNDDRLYIYDEKIYTYRMKILT